MKPLDKANDFLQNSAKYFEWEKLKLVHDLKSQVEELQKALEQIYHLRPVACEWTDEKYYEKFAECEDIARQALERSEPK